MLKRVVTTLLLMGLAAPALEDGTSRADDGSGVLGEGALTEGYNGPCPPSSHLYEITVKALDANGKELASAGKKRMFP
jgi:hypothetical protein